MRSCNYLVSVVFIISIMFILAWRGIIYLLDAELAIPIEDISFIIDNGESFSSVVSRLEQNRVVSDDLLLRIYSRVNNFDGSIREGEYNLSYGLSIRSLMSKFVSGDVVRHKITFPEGITLRQAIDRLSEEKNITNTLTGVDDPKLAELSGKSNSEGLFLADTYTYYRGASDFEILTQAHEVLVHFLEPLWRARAPELPYKTSYEALILSSIIEKETALPVERSQIAGVFVRRLKIGMRLQADPTVIYGLGSEFDGNLRRIHLNDKNNTYNTYRNNGLPPTPIALSGRDSVIAAFNPDSGTAIYFVADGEGGHIFNTSLDGHNASVKKYLMKAADAER